jgi:hypothetical protein
MAHPFDDTRSCSFNNHTQRSTHIHALMKAHLMMDGMKSLAKGRSNAKCLKG